MTASFTADKNYFDDQHLHHDHKHLGVIDRILTKLKKEEHETRESQKYTGSLVHTESDYVQLADELTDIVWGLHKKTDAWKLEKGDNPVDGMVHSTFCKKIKKKVYRLQGELDFRAQYLWEECAYHLEDNSKWNPTLKENRVLHSINDNTDIAYTIVPEAAGGLVSARDFVNLRRWEEKDGSYLSLVRHTTYSEMPPQKKYIRGENGPGGFIFTPSSGDPNKCRFVWYLNTNLKGWLPQHAIDFGLTGVMFDYLKYLRIHISDLKKQCAS